MSPIHWFGKYVHKDPAATVASMRPAGSEAETERLILCEEALAEISRRSAMDMRTMTYRIYVQDVEMIQDQRVRDIVRGTLRGKSS